MTLVNAPTNVVRSMFINATMTIPLLGTTSAEYTHRQGPNEPLNTIMKKLDPTICGF